MALGVDAFLFHQQKCAQFYQGTHLAAVSIFYDVHLMSCTRKISINLLVQKNNTQFCQVPKVVNVG